MTPESSPDTRPLWIPHPTNPNRFQLLCKQSPLQLPPLRVGDDAEVLNLLRKLPTDDLRHQAHVQIRFDTVRLRHAEERGLDLRPLRSELMDPVHLAMDQEICTLVNPTHRAMRGVYFCSGFDWAHFVLSSDVTEAIFVDHAQPSKRRFEEALALWDKLSEDQYLKNVRRSVSGHHPVSGCVIEDLELYLVAELKRMGVEHNSGGKKIEIIDDGAGVVSLRFHWSYLGQKERQYKITLVAADITNPQRYPAALTGMLKAGIDLFYFRAGYELANCYHDFIPKILPALRPGGALITNDVGCSGTWYPLAHAVTGLDPFTLAPRTTDTLEALKATARELLTLIIPEGRNSKEALGYGWDMSVWNLLPSAEPMGTRSSQ